MSQDGTNLSDMDTVEHNKRLRQLIIAKTIGANAEHVDNLDPAKLKIALTAMDGNDRIALGRARLALDNRIANDNASRAQEVIGQIFKLDANQRALITEIDPNKDYRDAVLPFDVPADVAPAFVVPETSTGVGIQDVTYTEFFARSGD